MPSQAISLDTHLTLNALNRINMYFNEQFDTDFEIVVLLGDYIAAEQMTSLNQPLRPLEQEWRSMSAMIALRAHLGGAQYIPEPNPNFGAVRWIARHAIINEVAGALDRYPVNQKDSLRSVLFQEDECTLRVELYICENEICSPESLRGASHGVNPEISNKYKLKLDFKKTEAASSERLIYRNTFKLHLANNQV